MKRLLFFLMAIIFAISAQSQGEITIGNGTGTGLFPINHYYKYNYSQMLYDQSSLMPGTISAIKFKYSASVGYTANPIVVYMKNTSKTSFESSTDYDSVGLVQVFSGSVTSSTGWVTIALNTPFVYDGLGSLLIAVDNNTGSYPGTYSSYWNNTPTTNNKTLNASSDTYNTDPLNPNGNSALKAVSQSLPNLTIVITPSDPGFCFAPTNVNSSNIISEGAKISWNFNVNVSSYSIEYKTSSQTWAESTIITGINDTLYNLSGLIANTIYDIRVSPECSTSLSTSLSFRTACSEISLLPYNEFFDSYGTGSTIFPPCWSKITSNTYPYIATTYSSSPGSLYMYTASGAYNYLVTPEFDASIPINSLSAFFKLYKTSAAYNITVGVMTDPTDVSTFDSIINLTPISTSIWETFGVDFANYTGSGQYIAFKVQGYGATNSMYIDDLEIIETPSCAIPTNLTQLTTTSNSIELDWDSNDDANCLGWIIDYKTSDDLVWQTENVTSHPYVISNLSSGVMYNVRLRAICTSQDTTKYTNIINCGMPCEPISVFPWEEGFENSWWVGDGIGGTTDSRPWCWVNLNGGTQTSGFWRKTTSSSYIHSGSGAAQMYSGSTTAGLSGDWLITPVFSLTENQILRFWAKGYSTYTDILSVKVIDATTNGIVNEYSDTSLFVDIMPNTIIPSSDWVEYEVNLSRFSGNYQIAFVRNTTGGNYLNIDDISIIDLPACARPTNVEITSINLSEAVFEWMPGHTGDASWCLYYKTNFDIFYDSVLVNTYTYTLQNLIPHATYTYYLRTKCGTELSEPTNISTFTTTAPIVNCGTITQFPWIENFDGLASDAFPQCWSRPVIYNTYPKTSTSSSRVQSAPTSLEIHSAVGSPTYAITPQLGVDINQLMVTFWAKAESATSSGTIEVGVMSDPTDLTTFESVQIIQPTNTSYNKYEVSFAGTTLNGANNYIAFRQNTISSYYYYWIDDIKVSELPTCFMPTALLASNETTTGFDLGWTDANSSLYNIQYMLSSQTDWVNATTISGVTSPYSLNGLSAGTSYKVRLQTDCGTEQSEWSLPITNSTACGAITQFPWTEGFENTFVSAILPGNKTSPLCWYIVDSLNTSSYYWQTSSTAYSGSKAVYMYGYASSTTTTTTYNNNDWLISPIITLTGSERLNFWSKKSSSSYYPDLLIYAMDVSQGDLNPTIPNTNFVLIGKVDTAVLSTTYSEFEFNLSTLVGDYRLAFVRKKIANGSVYIDDVKVDAIPSCASPLDISATSTTNSIEVSVTPSEVTDNGWKLLFREVNSANWNSLNITSNIVTIPNLQPQMEYEIYAKTLCSDASYSLPTNSIFVATKQIPVQTPYVCNFEAQGNNGWFIKNGASVNRWMIGTPVGAPSNALFVSNNNANLAYSVGLQNVVIAEKLFNITSPDSLELSFDLMVGGESTWDFLKVFFVDMDTVFAPSIEETYFSYDIYSEGIIMQNETNNFINLIPITHLTTRFVSPGIGVQKKLIFVWRNDGSAGNAISAYIDNISLLNIITPYPPTNLQATPSITTSQLSWTPGAAEIGWQVRKGETGALVNVTNANYQANALSPSTEYTYYIRSYYGDTLYSVWVPVTFRSLAIPQRVSTLAATDIDQTTATLHGTIIAGSDPITDQGFEYRVSGSSTWTPISVMQDDTIVYNLSGLSAYTEYEYRSFASTDYITIYGRTQDFTTLPAPPTALTSSATLIEQTIATLNGVISQGSMPIIEKGFEWRLAGSSTWTTEISTLSENTIACSLAGLIASTDYEYRVFVSTASVTVYGTVENFTTLAIVPPTVTTTLPSAITQTIATLNANILLGSEIITGQGFEWRLLGASTWTTMPSVLMVGTITSNITGLVASTDYEYRAYSTTASGTVYGNQQVFTTLDIVPPSVITNDAIAVAQTVETLRGTITAGSELISAQGFEWRELGETIWTPLTVTLIDNAMIHNLNGLTANTEYEFRAYATTASAITYGTAQTFRTLAMPPPEVRTGLPTSIAQTSAILTGTVYETMAPIISLGFEWRLLGENTWTQIPTSLIDHIITYNLTGLTAYTDYEYRAYATTSEGSVYGVTQSFQTLPIAPTVVTNPATSITQTIATLNGTIASGSETITTKGFEWRKLGVGTWTTITLTGEEIIYNLTGIIANTSYEYRAYAITASGTVYGQTQNFTTLPIVPPTVVTDLATNVEQTLATLNGTITLGSETIISQGFEFRLASASAWTSIPVSGAITYNLTGLTPNRAYEFRAYAITESVTTYGMIQTFATPVISQVVETSFATAISETVATINANITSGSELIINQGFEWKLSSSSTWTTVISPLTGNTIAYALSGLTPNEVYDFKAFASTASATVYGQIQSFTTLAIPTIVVTNSPTSVGQTLATLNGTITLGSETITSQGFEWKMASGSTWTTITSPITANMITNNLTGLSANTAYEYRAYVINSSGTIYGQIMNFTTLAVPPTVVTNLATQIAQTVATLNGAITIGSESIINQGFEWKMSGANTWTPLISTLTNTTIMHNLTDLMPNTVYEFRAYATSLSGTVYGITQNFTTLAVIPPVVVTNVATDISQNTATINGAITIGSGAIILQGFEWRMANANTWQPLTTTLTGNAITHNLIGLMPNTAYVYRAYAITSTGTVYGTSQNFTTLAIIPPTLITSPATLLSQTMATLNGTITMGSEMITSQGFEYKISNSNTWMPIAANLIGNAITYNLIGLMPNTTYEYRAYAITTSGTAYGTSQTFTTLAVIQTTVMTNAATAISQTAATLNGTIAMGSEAITTQGFEWALSSSSVWTITTENPTGNAITHNLTGLAPNSAYKYRAYAITSAGTVYGQTQTFTTISITPPTVLTSGATAITENTATLNATISAGTEAITSKGFEWRVSNTNIWMPITIIGTPITHNLTGLIPNTAYEFRAYATTASGDVYGQIQYFATLAIMPPTVITNAAIPTSGRTATISGTITSGTEAIITQGFEWKEAGISEWTAVEVALTGNTITYNLTGLTPNKSYRFRAGALTASGITYGETQTFTTLGLYGTEGNDISIKMYPNPANTQTKLIVSGINGEVKIVLSDVQGRILKTITTEALSGVMEQTIDLNELVEGVYYIRIQNSDINRTQKLIVK